MRVYSLNELFCMARNELFALHAETVTKLSDFAAGSPEEYVAHDLLRHIRRVLARGGPS